MKIVLLTLLGWLAVGGGLRADDLTVTLANGKTVTFQTVEQKAKFEAALKQQATRTNQTAAQDYQQQTAKKAELGHTALDEQPTAGASVNTKMPQLTADYYLASPAAWLGKHVALCVAFVEPGNQPGTKDGLQAFAATTYNVRPGATDHHPVLGGKIIILVDPDLADQLTTQCGTKLRVQDDFVKTTLIHGELQAAEPVSGPNPHPDWKPYCFRVER